MKLLKGWEQARARGRARGALILRRVLEEDVYEPTDKAGSDGDVLGRAKDYLSRSQAFRGKAREIAGLRERTESTRERCARVEAEYKLLLPELRAARDAAQTALRLAMVVDSLECHRRKLEDGKACPLCGATDHPFARGNHPVKSDCQTALEAAEAKTAVPDPDAKEAEVAELKWKVEALVKELGEIDAKLKIDDERLERRNELTGAREVAAVQREKWDRLNAWLGGANGEKFKRYAQGITLRQLLKASNPHLAAMTQGRYEMAWDPEGPDASALLPSIVDKDQGGETRPVTNLSGGERFQVSLALALGLSEMSSDRLAVDSLFLDEGFGTLCRLQQDGKLIGVISHVTEVGERITTQIEVKKVGGGLSVLEGAGVSRG